MPALAGALRAGHIAEWRRALVRGGLLASALYTYPEMAPPILAGVVLIALPECWRRRAAWRAGLREGAMACLVAAALLTPGAAVLVPYLPQQIRSAAGSDRPGHTLFTGLLHSRDQPAAFWGLGGEHRLRRTRDVSNAIGVALSLLAAVGLAALAWRGEWGLAAIAVLLVTGRGVDDRGGSLRVRRVQVPGRRLVVSGHRTGHGRQVPRGAHARRTRPVDHRGGGGIAVAVRARPPAHGRTVHRAVLRQPQPDPGHDQVPRPPACSGHRRDEARPDRGGRLGGEPVGRVLPARRPDPGGLAPDVFGDAARGPLDQPRLAGRPRVDPLRPHRRDRRSRARRRARLEGAVGEPRRTSSGSGRARALGGGCAPFRTSPKNGLRRQSRRSNAGCPHAQQRHSSSAKFGPFLRRTPSARRPSTGDTSRWCGAGRPRTASAPKPKLLGGAARCRAAARLAVGLGRVPDDLAR